MGGGPDRGFGNATGGNFWGSGCGDGSKGGGSSLAATGPGFCWVCRMGDGPPIKGSGPEAEGGVSATTPTLSGASHFSEDRLLNKPTIFARNDFFAGGGGGSGDGAGGGNGASADCGGSGCKASPRDCGSEL